MSAQNELPPGWDDSFLDVGKRRDAQLLVVWTHWERKSGITREEYATMRAAQEFTRVVCELLGNEGSGMDVSTDVLQDMLTAAGVTP